MFFAIRFFGLSTYRNVNGFLVAALYCSLSTLNSDDILLDSLDDGNSLNSSDNNSVEYPLEFCKMIDLDKSPSNSYVVLE